MSFRSAVVSACLVSAIALVAFTLVRLGASHTPASGAAAHVAADGRSKSKPRSVGDLSRAQQRDDARHSASAARTLTPVPAQVQRILPELKHAVDDWRAYQPERIAVAPYADLQLKFERVSVRFEEGRTVWVGRNQSDGAFLVTVATRNEWHAVAEVPGADSFEFHVSGDTANVAFNNGPHRCGNELGLLKKGAAADGASLAEAPGEDLQRQAAAHVVDVIFFYDAGVLASRSGNREAVDTTIAGRVASANVILENSGVTNVRWRFVAAYQVPEYTATDKLENDLDLISEANNPVGQFVAGKCEAHGADQAVIFVSGTRDYAGIAWVPGNLGSVAEHSAAHWNTSYGVLAHEMAHNFGCRHDRVTTESPDEDTRYWFGHRFTFEGRDTGTTMSYADYVIPYFSNPQVSYRGVPTGIPEGQPRAADNARVLRETASAMAAVRSATVAPIITRNPESVTVGRGRTISLSVAATGGRLNFQWRRNGTDIPGATGIIYTKSDAADADAGSYSVAVSNVAGQAISAEAVVTVAEVASAPQGGGGGGGGGGSLGAGATALLIAMLIARGRSYVRKRR